MQRRRVVCFDLGGVIVRICRSFAEAAERAELPLRGAGWLESEAAVLARRRIVFEYQRGALATADYFAELVPALGGHYTQGELARIHDAWLIDEYVGALELVEELVRLPDVVAACLSNTNERHWELLAPASGPAHYPAVLALEHRFASHLLGLNKPEVGIFSEFQQQIGARASDIVFFDDTRENVEAARLQGWDAHLVDPARDTVLQMREHLVALGIGR